MTQDKEPIEGELSVEEEIAMELEMLEGEVGEIELPVMEIIAPNGDILELYDNTSVRKQIKSIREFMRLHKNDQT